MLHIGVKALLGISYGTYCAALCEEGVKLVVVEGGWREGLFLVIVVDAILTYRALQETRFRPSYGVSLIQFDLNHPELPSRGTFMRIQYVR